MTRHSSLHRLLTGVICAIAVMLGGCASVPPPGPIATVAYASGEAFIIRAGTGQTPARNGDQLFARDGFRTENGTLQLLPRNGGSVEVQPNTDPIIEEAFCFAISLFKKGKIRVTGSGICVNEVYQHSDVGYEITQPGTMRVWVLEGRVNLLTPPFETIPAGTRADIIAGKIINRSPFSPVEFNRTFPNIKALESQQPIIL